MHRTRIASDASALRELIRFALKAKMSGSLIHRLDCVLMLAEGHCVQAVADWFGVSERSLQRWARAACVSAISNLTDHSREGRPPILTSLQALAIRCDLKSSPAAFGYSDIRWTGKRLALHLNRCYGIQIGVRSCQRIISRSDRGRGDASLSLRRGRQLS